MARASQLDPKVQVHSQSATPRARDGGGHWSLQAVSSTGGWGKLAPPHYASGPANGATLTTIAGGHTLARVEAIVGSYKKVGASNSILERNVAIAGTGETVKRTCPDHMQIHGRHASGCISNVEIVGGRDTSLLFELRGSKVSLSSTATIPAVTNAGSSWSRFQSRSIRSRNQS